MRSLPRTSARTTRGGHARGYTLLELLLVVGILMICAGAVAPSVMGMLADYHLKEGAQKVRTALAETRVHAIDATSIYQFRFEPGGRHFLAVPVDAEVLATPGTAMTADGQSITQGMFEGGLLPETISFQASAPTGPPPSEPPLAAASDPGWIAGSAKVPNGPEFAGVAWSDPIYFRPDGTGTDATFLVVDTRGSAYRFTIRETTGEIFVHATAAETH